MKWLAVSLYGNMEGEYFTVLLNMDRVVAVIKQEDGTTVFETDGTTYEASDLFVDVAKWLLS